VEYGAFPLIVRAAQNNFHSPALVAQSAHRIAMRHSGEWLEVPVKNF
jgi:hypothetical protein